MKLTWFGGCAHAMNKGKVYKIAGYIVYERSLRVTKFLYNNMYSIIIYTFWIGTSTYLLGQLVKLD